MKTIGTIVKGAAMALALAAVTPAPAQAAPPAAYTPITYDAAGQTITLTGHDMTIDQILAIARHGAKVALTPAARQRSADAYGLLLEAAAEGVSVYWFNRGAGQQRETVIFSGDPTAPENADKLRARQLATFSRGEGFAYGPEIHEEELVRAIMAIRANTMSYEAASPGLTQALLDLLNNGITPVVLSRGTLGEGDLATMGNIGAAMVGVGEVYYKGQRMPAAQALVRRGAEAVRALRCGRCRLLQHERLCRRACSPAGGRRARAARLDRHGDRARAARHEFQRHTALFGGSEQPALPVD